MMPVPKKLFCNTLATVAVAAVPIYATWSLIAAYHTAPALPNLNTAQVVVPGEISPPVHSHAQGTESDQDITVVDWTFAGKGKPSPYQ
jgi:hypothetical protein